MYQRSSYHGGLLPSGWFLVIHGRHEFTDAEVKQLSQAAEVVACFVEEHVMVSKAACWKNGQEVWSVTHDAQESLHHLEAQGELPLGFAAIRDRLTKQQEEEDDCDFIFDIPVSLAAEITGYRHDETRKETFETFVRPSFFEGLFG
ncbi:hypothetical protein [Pedosphaera parvula]|uniref:hypothetical protein n=1 Tax=Pedosphaera parvula TaxID=1032527 RepID=UPI0003128002|nr:hypothetical protein [Pedosphaera parvula]